MIRSVVYNNENLRKSVVVFFEAIFNWKMCYAKF